MTDAGQVYYTRAATGLAHLLEAEAAVTEAAAEPSGRLRVTAPADLGNHLLADILREMHSQCPRVQVELVLTSHYVDLIAEGIDVAIRAGRLKDSTLVAKLVGSARWAPFASPSYLSAAAPLDTPQALRQHVCLQFTPLGKEHWTLSHASGSVTVPMSGHWLVNDIGVISAMAQAGEGVAVLPEYLCQRACREGRLVRVLPEWQAKTDPLYIVYPRQRFLPARQRVFVDLAAQTLRKWLE